MTALQHNIFSELEYISYRTQTRDSRLSPEQNHCQGQLKTPQSVSIHKYACSLYMDTELGTIIYILKNMPTYIIQM